MLSWAFVSTLLRMSENTKRTDKRWGEGEFEFILFRQSERRESRVGSSVAHILLFVCFLSHHLLSRIYKSEVFLPTAANCFYETIASLSLELRDNCFIIQCEIQKFKTFDEIFTTCATQRLHQKHAKMPHFLRLALRAWVISRLWVKKIGLYSV